VDSNPGLVPGFFWVTIQGFTELPNQSAVIVVPSELQNLRACKHKQGQGGRNLIGVIFFDYNNLRNHENFFCKIP
jgi:hypothetical protein